MARTTFSGPVKSENGFETSGPVIFSALPTTDPVVAGQLWSDNGTIKVSEGGPTPPPPGQGIYGTFVVGARIDEPVFGAASYSQPNLGSLADVTPAGILYAITEGTTFGPLTQVGLNIGTFGDFTVSDGFGINANINGSSSILVTIDGISQLMSFQNGPGAPFITAAVYTEVFGLSQKVGQTVSYSIVIPD